MKNLKISKKLIVSFLIVTAFSFVSACVGIYSATSINANYVYLMDMPVNREVGLRMMQNDFTMMRYRAANFVMNSGDLETINGTLVPQYQSAYKSFQTNFALYLKNNDADNRRDPDALAQNREKATQLEQLIRQFDASANATLALARDGESKAADDILKEIIPLAGEINAAMDELITPAVTFVDDSAASMSAYARTMMIVQIVVAAACLGFAVIFAVYIAGMIGKPVTYVRDVLQMIGLQGVVQFTEEQYRMAENFATAKDEVGESVNMLMATARRLETVGHSLNRVASGDLTVTLPLLSPKDTIGGAVNVMLDNLNEMFDDIRIASNQVSSGAGQVSQGAQGLAAGSSQQAASIQGLSASLSEMQKKTNDAAEDSANARDANVNTSKSLDESIRSMGRMLAAMKEIDESSVNITKIIKVIDDIAFQTNILALNAAVEAARAGQHGKGFAVVADEVRNLAGKSAEAAKETSALIAGSTERVKEGNEIVARTNANLEAAVASAKESTRLIEQVAQASTEQATAIVEINNGMDQISTVVQANSATAQESAATAQEMSAQAVVMNDIVAKFKVRNMTRVGKMEAGEPNRFSQRAETPAFDPSISKY